MSVIDTKGQGCVHFDFGVFRVHNNRPNISAFDAVGVTRESCWQMPCVLEFDIKGLFDNIDQEKRKNW